MLLKKGLLLGCTMLAFKFCFIRAEGNDQLQTQTVNLSMLARPLWDYNVKERVRDFVEGRQSLEKLVFLGTNLEVTITKTKFSDVYSVVSRLDGGEPKTVLTRSKTVSESVLDTLGNSHEVSNAAAEEQAPTLSHPEILQLQEATKSEIQQESATKPQLTETQTLDELTLEPKTEPETVVAPSNESNVITNPGWLVRLAHKAEKLFYRKRPSLNFGKAKIGQCLVAEKLILFGGKAAIVVLAAHLILKNSFKIQQLAPRSK